jgi:pyridoxamine 5'-phosphate oxidase
MAHPGNSPSGGRSQDGKKFCSDYGDAAESRADEEQVSITPYQEPFETFNRWYTEARASEPRDANAMTLATAGREGRPSARMVLLKGADERGFVFYTNLTSRKGAELAVNPQAALCFHWKSLGRQVRVEGAVERVGDAEADAYFASRPRDSQIGAWASDQSQLLDDRADLERRVAEAAARFGEGPIPRPPHWSGFRVVPDLFEFWQDKPFRLHDRIFYRRKGPGWDTGRLFP